MTNEELLEIHFNNSDLNITNLAAINNSSVEIVRDILKDFYDAAEQDRCLADDKAINDARYSKMF